MINKRVGTHANTDAYTDANDWVTT